MLNVLSLHQMGDPLGWRESVRSLEYMFAHVRQDLNLAVHGSDIPLPAYMKEVDYDLIVLGPTFLCNRYNANSLKRVLNEYEFVAHSTACKVALPQDDYDCSEILEDWLIQWGVDRVYTVCPDHWNCLYPRLSKANKIRLGYTCYISETWIEAWTSPRLHEARTVDVCYRATKLAANFGSLGQLKWKIANRFIHAANACSDLKLDISVEPKDIIPGSDWHSFLECSKFCLATPSGSSLHDPKGLIRSCVNAFLRKSPASDFDEISSACFDGVDERFIFSAISPRNVEAALAQTVQLATPGTYSGLMKPYKHYIPLSEDCSNIDEVVMMMADRALVRRIMNDCKEVILAEPRLRLRNIVNEIIEFAHSRLSLRGRNIAFGNDGISAKFKRYNSEIDTLQQSYWRTRRAWEAFRFSAVKYRRRFFPWLLQ